MTCKARHGSHAVAVISCVYTPDTFDPVYVVATPQCTARLQTSLPEDPPLRVVTERKHAERDPKTTSQPV